MAATLKNFEVCPYTLQSAVDLNAREGKRRQGYLVRCEFEDKLIGYADFHPLNWESAPSTESAQWKHSLRLAYVDAQARQKKVSLFKGLGLLESHFLIPDIVSWDFYHLKELRFKKFKSLKLKLGRDFQSEKDALLKLKSEIKSDFKLRLDFNSVNSFEQWSQWEHWLNENLKDSIEFIEDPCAWDEKVWRLSHLPLALDFEGEAIKDTAPAFVERIIWKPALGETVNFERWRTAVIVTHIMDHPLGQLGALYMAQTHNIQTIGGFLNPGLEDSLGFSKHLNSYGPWVQPEQGCGWGFDDQLKELKWLSL